MPSDTPAKRNSHTRPRRTREGGDTPRLPHERDESSDSQVGQQDVMRQAQEDLRRGLTDTDKGPPLDEVYARTLRGSKGGPKRGGTK